MKSRRATDASASSLAVAARPPLEEGEESAAPPLALELMRRCWDADADARPTFAEVSRDATALAR